MNKNHFLTKYETEEWHQNGKLYSDTVSETRYEDIRTIKCFHGDDEVGYCEFDSQKNVCVVCKIYIKPMQKKRIRIQDDDRVRI
jgi:hypothetical protein